MLEFTSFNFQYRTLFIPRLRKVWEVQKAHGINTWFEWREEKGEEREECIGKTI
jgi:hypothetical protein